MKLNLLLLAGVVVLVAVPLLMFSPQEGVEAFPGADGQAEEAVREINPDYRPWLHAIWEPPSAEIESMLFALQAAIGAGLVCYCIGYYRGRHIGTQAKRGPPSDAPR